MSGRGEQDAARRSGTVALVGWTNVGKSTLLNRLVGEKLAAVADAAQTTRHWIRGVCNVTDRGQLVLLDTPGLHRPKHLMNRGMVELIRRGIRDADVALLVADASRGLGAGDGEVARLVFSGARRRLVALNKVDRVRPKTDLLPMMRHVQEVWGISAVFPISAQTGEGCEELFRGLWSELPEGPPLYDDEAFTDQTVRELAAEWIREKLLQLMREELPHAMAVRIGRWHEREDGLTEIEARIVVERESQKGIVIGRGGELLKAVGTDSRIELERLLDRRVFLKLWVEVLRDWRDDPTALRQLGLPPS